MIDETGASTAAGTTGPAGNTQEPIVAYCQQCGRSLTSSSQRRVGNGIFCEPCATVRQAQPAGWTPVNHGATSGAYKGTSRPAVPGEPNPVLGGFLGLIPGVGAMYNGQYAKGVLHLIVFVVLVSLADNLNWVLWWFVWGWIFYQAFEAYHTAQARRDGQPLPDPFGWNEFGERLGFSRHWTHTPPPPAAAPVPPQPTDYAHAERASDPASRPYPFESNGSFAGSTVPPVSGPPPGAAVPPPPSTGFTDIPYNPTYTGATSPASVQMPFSAGANRFPVGAAWLIGLGVLFLLGNILPSWHIDGRWLVPVLLAGIAFWTGGRRLAALHDARSGTGPVPLGAKLPDNTADALLAPGLLLTIAVLLALQEASLIAFRHSWPALLIVWGGLLFLQRVQPPPPTGAASDPASPVSPGVNSYPR